MKPKRKTQYLSEKSTWYSIHWAFHFKCMEWWHCQTKKKEKRKNKIGEG